MSFQKDRSCQCRLINPEGLSLGHRRLRFSFQINDFKDQDRKNRPNCLAPVRGGGGYLAAPVFRVKQFFLKNFLFTKPLREERRRRLSSEGRSPCQPGFSAFLRFPKPKLRRPQQTAGKTERHPSTQSSNSIEARNLTEPTDQSKKLFQTPAPTKTPKTQSPKPRWASPSPSEAAIYEALFTRAIGKTGFCDLSTDRAVIHSARPGPIRRPTPPLYRCAGFRLPAWPGRSGI
jgi:hypothetical protein